MVEESENNCRLLVFSSSQSRVIVDAVCVSQVPAGIKNLSLLKIGQAMCVKISVCDRCVKLAAKLKS